MDEQAPTTTAPLEKPLTVLVADDHPLWRDALARDLADHGIDVVGTAGDGPAAVARTVSRSALRPTVKLVGTGLARTGFRIAKIDGWRSGLLIKAADPANDD